MKILADLSAGNFERLLNWVSHCVRHITSRSQERAGEGKETHLTLSIPAAPEPGSNQLLSLAVMYMYTLQMDNNVAPVVKLARKI